MDKNEKFFERMARAAKEVSTGAYCPYSKFRVGAAVLGESGEIFSGCNVENAAYGLTICAERNAIFHAVAEGARKILMVVVYTPTPKPSASCGSCRQVMYEFGPEVDVYAICDGSEILHMDMHNLLPNAFGPSQLLNI